MNQVFCWLENKGKSIPAATYLKSCVLFLTKNKPPKNNNLKEFEHKQIPGTTWLHSHDTMILLHCSVSLWNTDYLGKAVI